MTCDARVYRCVDDAFCGLVKGTNDGGSLANFSGP